jgi:hypothetical protein
MERTRAHIRPYRPRDLDALYRICLLTGDDGQDATSLFHDPRLLGHLFAAPYGLFEASLAFVAEDTAGVGGCIVGALDTQVFEEKLESKWCPLRTRYPDPPPGPSVRAVDTRPACGAHDPPSLAHPGRPGSALPIAPAHQPATTPTCRPAGMGAS